MKILLLSLLIFGSVPTFAADVCIFSLNLANGGILDCSTTLEIMYGESSDSTKMAYLLDEGYVIDSTIGMPKSGEIIYTFIKK